MRHPSHLANAQLVQTADQYQATIKQAAQSDTTVRQKWDEWSERIEALEADVTSARSGIDQTSAEAQKRIAELEAAFDAATVRVNRLIDVLNPPKG